MQILFAKEYIHWVSDGMKKNRKIIVLMLSLAMISMYGCDKEKINDIDVAENLVIDIKNEKVEYKTIKNGEVSNFEMDEDGTLMAYNGKNDVMVFSKVENEKNQLKIIANGKEELIDINGYLETVYVSTNGMYTLYKTNSASAVVEYFIMNNKTLKATKLSEKILVSGNMIRFLNNEEVIFYGVDIENKQSGIFIYNISSGEYKLEQKIIGSVVSYIDVLDEKTILYSESIDQRQKLCILNLDDLKTKEITDEFEHVEDSIMYNDNLYISAQENYKLNLYRINIKDNKINRLTFDFPESLGRESKLLAENNKIYFSDIKGDIYSYNIDEKSTSIVEKNSGEHLIMNK